MVYQKEKRSVLGKNSLVCCVLWACATACYSEESVIVESAAAEEVAALPAIIMQSGTKASIDAIPVVPTTKEINDNPVDTDTDKSQTPPIYTSSQAVKRPQAKSVELDEPVVAPDITPQENVLAPVVDAIPEEQSPVATDVMQVEASATSPVLAPEPLIILETEVLPSTSTRLSWSPSQSLEGIATPTPILIVNGAHKGPVLCLTAAIHGDELNGIEVVRRVLYNLEPEQLSGTVIGVPIVNLQGFHRGSRYLTDRRDINRYFPGNPGGSSASRIAYSFFNEVIRHCNALVDLHTGSFHRTNLPQLRADLSDPKVVELTQGFGATVVLQSVGAAGTLRRAAVDVGIPAVTLEAGESMRLQEAAVKHGVKGIRTLMNKMGLTKKFSLWGDPEPVYYNSIWIRAERGGILFSDVALGDRVKEKGVLGVVTDPITNIKSQILSPHNGRVIGMALNQVVLPGFAAFHIGIRAPDDDIPEPEVITVSPGEDVARVIESGNVAEPISDDTPGKKDIGAIPTGPVSELAVATDDVSKIKESANEKVDGKTTKASTRQEEIQVPVFDEETDQFD